MELEKELKTRFRSERQKATLNIMFTANWLQQFHNKTFRPKKLSVQQFNILRILRGNGFPMTIRQIKERMLERESDVSRIIEKLRNTGLVKRTVDPNDRRAVRCSITKKGSRLLDELDESEKYFDTLTEGLTKSELNHLNDLLDKLRTKAPCRIHE